MQHNTPIEATTTAAQSARQRRMAVLARTPVSALENALVDAGHSEPWSVLRGPETGMVMVRGRMGGEGGAFNLGEMTVTRCTVRLADGRVGHAYAAGRDRRHAELSAVIDALMLDEATTPDALTQALADMAAAQQAAREDRSRRAAATRVDFFTMVRMG